MNIGLLTAGSLSDFRLKTLEPILADGNFAIKVAVVDNRPGLTAKQKLKKNLMRGRGGYIAVMALERFLSNRIQEVSTIDYCHKNQIDLIETTAPYSSETIEQLRAYDLDLLILVGGFGIIKKPMLNVAPLGVLSYHHGDMRKYRGMPPALWELYNGETEMGVTVQILSAGLDSGVPIEEKSISIRKSDTLKKLQDRAMDESVDMLYNAIVKLSDKDAKFEKLSEYGKVYTLPNLRQWLILNLKLLWRRL